jgi:hypothetical protein
MCAHHQDNNSHTYNNLTPVALSILVMGLSLAVVIVLWVWFGHIGPSFSADTLVEQQKTLRYTYHLPPQPVITDPKQLLTPPSLRNSHPNTTANTSRS